MPGLRKMSMALSTSHSRVNPRHPDPSVMCLLLIQYSWPSDQNAYCSESPSQVGEFFPQASRDQKEHTYMQTLSASFLSVKN